MKNNNIKIFIIIYIHIFSMADNWDEEDWENFDVDNSYTEKQLKILEERKLVEESDNKLLNEMFYNEANNIKQISENLTTYFMENKKNEKIQNNKRIKFFQIKFKMK
jgi:hypothetical protein